MYKKRAALYLSTWLLTAPLVAWGAQDVISAGPPLRQALEQSLCPIPVEQQARQRLRVFYELLDHRPQWQAAGRLDGLARQLEQLADDGLDPADYLPVRSPATLTDPLQQACAELRASHGYLQALQHLSQGYLPRTGLDPLWRLEPLGDERVSLLILALGGLDDLPGAFAQARPSLPQYQALRAHYARQRSQPLPPFEALPSGPLLRPGQKDARTPLLRRSLFHAGYLPDKLAPPGADPLRHDPELVAALERFQQRHGLKDDGVLGPATLAELNIGPAQRRAQLRVNLERWRWLAGDMEANLLVVDIAGGRLLLYRDGEPVWETRTQVGRADRPTPQLKSRIARLTLNPTWTVPPTILREDKLPQIRRDLGFLARHQMSVLDHQGRRLDPRAVDWSRPRGILLRQAAGPSNPLGKVALRFDNPFSVYLHDTPSQRLFAEAQRTFSSGCVRVEHALGLIDLLLVEGEHARVGRLLDSGRTHEYRLVRPMPILMAYWTVEVDSDNRLRFRPDLYRLDAALQQALARDPPPEQRNFTAGSGF